MYYYLYEEPGHVIGLVNTSNQLVNQYTYEPFGAALTTSESVVQPFRFTARELDAETGLYYYRARYYDPQLARFVSEDPIGLAGGINRYAYVGNDPVNAIDPSGTCLFRMTIPNPFDWFGPGIQICIGKDDDDQGGAGERTSGDPNAWAMLDAQMSGTRGISRLDLSGAGAGSPSARGQSVHDETVRIGVALLKLFRLS